MTSLLAHPGLDSFEKILVFLLTLSVLIVLHEAGHFWVARYNGVRVNDFAIGFGPTLLKWTSPRSGTNYRINLVLLGGYCAMQGEDGKNNEAEQQRTFRAHAPADVSDNFQAKTPLARLAIIVAGPFANFVLAYLILLAGVVLFGSASASFSTKVGPVMDGSPAAKAGLAVGDDLVAIDGVRYGDADALVKKIQTSAGVPLRITYARHGVERTVSITPAAKSDGKGRTVGQIGFERIPVFKRVGVLEAFALSGLELREGIDQQLGGLVQIVVHPAQRAGNLTGVIGMGRVASVTQELGWAPYFYFAAMISIALGIFNLLPIPALDGGRASFIVAEMLRGRPIDAEREALVHFTGFAVLMALMVFTAYRDIANIVSGKGVF
jgi:regulator of sigma E protease